MKMVVQRVSSASVEVKEELKASIGSGLLIYLGIHKEDEEEAADWLVRKVLSLRIFQDEEGKMNRSIMDTGGEICLVSQFTLYGDTRKGTRPSFVHAAAPERAEPLYEYVAKKFRSRGVSVQSGVFGAMMKVRSLNDGPVTLLLERTSST